MKPRYEVATRGGPRNMSIAAEVHVRRDRVSRV
jgi:hypothetical protein